MKADQKCPKCECPVFVDKWFHIDEDDNKIEVLVNKCLACGHEWNDTREQ